jgi:uncharacterized protein YoxC
MTSKSNAEKQRGKGAPVMEIVKADTTAETNATTQAEPQPPTVEELQKQVQELTTRLKTLPQDLNSRIEYFNNKRELIRKLSKVETNAESLKTHLDQIAQIAAANDFETEEYILSIEGGSKYSKKQVFSLQNPVLIGDVLNYLLVKIEAKAEELKREIEA